MPRLSLSTVKMGLLQSAPYCVSTHQKNPHLRTVSSGFFRSRSLPDTFFNSPKTQPLAPHHRLFSTTTSQHNQVIKAVEVAYKALSTPETRVRDTVRNLNISGSIRAITMGKAAVSCMTALKMELGSQLKEGLVVGKHGDVVGDSGITGGHPIQDTFRPYEEVTRFLNSGDADDVLISVVSGGTTSIISAPDPSLERGVGRSYPVELFNRDMNTIVNAGLDIKDQNDVRALVTGTAYGRLLAHVKQTHVESLIVSDVLAENMPEILEMETVGSGPFQCAHRQFEEVITLMKDRGLWNKMSDVFQTYAIERVKQVGSPTGHVVRSTIVDNSLLVHERMADALRADGYDVTLAKKLIVGDPRIESQHILNTATYLMSTMKPGKKAVLFRGEPVPTFDHGPLLKSDKGGRCGALAVFLSRTLARCDFYPNLCGAAIATDGEDNQGASGAMFSRDSGKKLIASSERESLYNSHSLLRDSGDLYPTKRTGHNVGDSILVLSN